MLRYVGQMDFLQVLLLALSCVRWIIFCVRCIATLACCRCQVFVVGGGAAAAHLRDYCVIYACDLENTRNWSFVCIRKLVHTHTLTMRLRREVCFFKRLDQIRQMGNSFGRGKRVNLI